METRHDSDGIHTVVTDAPPGPQGRRPKHRERANSPGREGRLNSRIWCAAATSPPWRRTYAGAASHTKLPTDEGKLYLATVWKCSPQNMLVP